MEFEKKLSRLEEIVHKMEKGEVSLEDSLKLFEEGVKLSRECHQKLTDAELKVKKLVGFDPQGEAIIEPFNEDEK
ncbi:MAG: exodeoxyribonuclease VII small subunit [Bdellovibrionaceae bacterium]|nr:exodeoxyribonuclease VII small subunit [Bacteriovoracaceae bacterium]MCK6597240.1 exodeoxyribonuclease VII small subunit [Pseudobdellovibrionaceae bacterium]NUM58127.1 exodeoxyribonuclease VII small subunit [Pseudobdellovibrionaceae bacterium]